MGRAPQRIPIAGQQVVVPSLPGPVGAATARYPLINQPAAVALVDAQLAVIAELSSAPNGPGGVTPQELAMAQAVASYRTDRPGAIAGFQRTANVGSAEERAAGVILPTGTTWPALFGYGRMARQLDALRDQRRDPRDYVYSGRFDHAAFLADSATRLQGNRATAVKYTAASLPNFDRMLTFMETDSRIIDVRWMAYMFATAYWEAAGNVAVGRRRNGNPVNQFQTVIPIDEIGRGRQRDYGRPVKVERLGATRARITEWDGDQIEINERGYVLSRGQDGGAPYNSAASRAYAAAPGDERVYYGRGYVQLTWWYHYAMASVAIGRNFDLLWNPELAKEPDVAYRVMADGMITGRHYANRKRLQMFLAGSLTDYVGARAIVNAYDPQPTIVEAAKVFETTLLGARR
jgi:hypothetical protein